MRCGLAFDAARVSGSTSFNEAGDSLVITYVVEVVDRAPRNGHLYVSTGEVDRLGVRHGVI